MKLRLKRLYLNSQGYTTEGYYYGVDAPLYVAHDEDGTEMCVIRAANRKLAKAKVEAFFKRQGEKVEFYK